MIGRRRRGEAAGPPPPRRVERTDAEWQAALDPEAYRILRKHGTERAFTGALWDEKRPGIYRCGGCGTPLFDAKTKYESGTGWPSFWAPVDPSHVGEREDRSFFMRRTEVICAVCDGHLGHVFPDGPEPTGQRYCLNSAALAFEPAEATGEADQGRPPSGDRPPPSGESPSGSPSGNGEEAGR